MDVKKYVNNICKRYRTINPYEIADQMGILVHKMDLGRTRGLCYNSRRTKQIVLNYNLPCWIERFVLAHEIGHLVMHPQHNAPFLQSTFFCMDKYEIEANTFAVNLIIPDEELKSDRTIQELSSLYGLPEEVIKLKLNN